MLLPMQKQNNYIVYFESVILFLDPSCSVAHLCPTPQGSGQARRNVEPCLRDGVGRVAKQLILLGHLKVVHKWEK